MTAVVKPAEQLVQGGAGTDALPPADQVPLGHPPQEAPPVPARQTTVVDVLTQADAVVDPVTDVLVPVGVS